MCGRVRTELKDPGLGGVELVIRGRYGGAEGIDPKDSAGSGWQRCPVYRLRNVLSHVRGQAEMVGAFAHATLATVRRGRCTPPAPRGRDPARTLPA